MIFIDTCPKCGSDLNTMTICTYPPVNRVECPCCGWYNESQDKIVKKKFNSYYDKILNSVNKNDNIKGDLKMKKFCFEIPEDIKKEIEKILDKNIYTNEDFSKALEMLLNIIKNN